MSKKNNNPGWHEPITAIGDDLNDPIHDAVDDNIENTIEVGTIALVDGPLDPVPLAAGGHDHQEYAFQQSAASPMPNLDATATEAAATAKAAVQNAADTAAAKSQDVTQKIADAASKAKSAANDAGSATKNVISTTTSKIGSAGATGVQSAGTALWTVVQRSPLQALVFFASLAWLIRHHKAAASLPPVSLSDVTNDAAVKAGSIVGQVQATAGTLGSQVQEQAERGKGWFTQTLQDNPLAVGAMAIVFGAGLGFAVPETGYEHKLLGKTRDSLADKAQEAAQDLTQKVQNVAQSAVHEAIETAKEEAKTQGLAG